MMALAREPAAIIGALEALAIAVVSLIAYNLGWQETETALWLGIVTAAIALIGSFFTRMSVFSPATVHQDFEKKSNDQNIEYDPESSP